MNKIKDSHEVYKLNLLYKIKCRLNSLNYINKSIEPKLNFKK